MVRVCAALGSPSEVDELLAVLLALSESDQWLRDSPFLVGLPRFRLVAAAVERVDDFSRLLPAALHLLRHASAHTVDSDWEPLLGKAAQDRPPAAPREFFAAVADNDRLWDPRNGNAFLHLKNLNLPTDRDDFRAAIGQISGCAGTRMSRPSMWLISSGSPYRGIDGTAAYLLSVLGRVG